MTAYIVSIGLGKIPSECWYALSRKKVRYKGRSLLYSWSGGMFEYLMKRGIFRIPAFERPGGERPSGRRGTAVVRVGAVRDMGRLRMSVHAGGFRRQFPVPCVRRALHRSVRCA